MNFVNNKSIKRCKGSRTAKSKETTHLFHHKMHVPRTGSVYTLDTFLIMLTIIINSATIILLMFMPTKRDGSV